MVMMVMPLMEAGGRILNIVSAQGKAVFSMLYVAGGFITLAHIVYALWVQISGGIQEASFWLVWGVGLLAAVGVALVIHMGSKTTK